jgi:hypothetical protein
MSSSLTETVIVIVLSLTSVAKPDELELLLPVLPVVLEPVLLWLWEAADDELAPLETA